MVKRRGGYYVVSEMMYVMESITDGREMNGCWVIAGKRCLVSSRNSKKAKELGATVAKAQKPLRSTRFSFHHSPGASGFQPCLNPEAPRQSDPVSVQGILAYY